MTAYYARPISMPKTKREGLANAIQLAINALEGGDTEEALLQMVNLLDDVLNNTNSYSIDPETKGSRALGWVVAVPLALAFVFFLILNFLY